MAYLDTKIEQGYKLSNEALKKPNFDTEAFIVASLIRLMGAEKVDVVPESNIDEMTDTSKDLFVRFMHNKTVDNLKSYMLQIHQIISELYHTVDADKKAIIIDYIAKLREIS